MKYLNILEARLGRKATREEIEAFTVMWSEHCGYSHTKGYIRQLSKVGTGGNAGVVPLDDYHFLAFKVESHNHPSAIEPFNGAATGVGGIIRDVLAMGARPTAILDSLHMDKVIDGIIEGISDYGNSIGVPTVGGELRISDFYKYNPLVNVMAVGVGKNEHLIPSKATKSGQVIVIFGGATGRDGIHGASFASEDLTGEKATKLSIQVGDPFAEKLLIEAFLEMVEKGLVEGAQDLGAGGVLSATSELVARSGLGAIVHLERVPLRESDMLPIEILISESQERMAVVTSPEKAEEVLKIAKKHLLFGAVVAEVTDNGRYVAKYHDQIIIDVPAKLFEESPEEPIHDYTPSPFKKFRWIRFKDVDAHNVFERYDYMVGTDTILPPGFGPAVMRVKGSIGYSLTIHSRADIGAQDPYWGAYITVLEAIRKTLSAGAKPIAITDGINYADPDIEPLGLAGQMKGLKDACEQFNVPVASGNASLYNTYKRKGIPPTLVVGMVGKVENLNIPKPTKGHVYAIGYPDFSIEREGKLQEEIVRLVKNGHFVLSMHDYSRITTFKTALSKLGMNLRIQIPRTEPVHQMIIVFGEPKTNLPVRKIGFCC
ncbi:phosphoribosylformylglycinamidine synthase II [Fervidobacterium pennivorans DSM 9078]|uniref:Phosphoribosylformylglycinamidine synthase subunit PurL n=1 Tax=Fervidobacterium pennivorans (strain DSM 9078 / Ven5) TaxID=771875 RepID=H9UD59_FERPD|nr:phosphoribosylformylglycinamidine synthase subunit PurL [Fervidobacterium pennivorans]AFG35452.1 phosphoribosylformylglycinamidine synthase II [Fervidobacterium pennivorans DSM 9078]